MFQQLRKHRGTHPTYSFPAGGDNREILLCIPAKAEVPEPRDFTRHSPR